MTSRASVTVTCDLCFETHTPEVVKQSHAAIGYWDKRQIDDLPYLAKETT